MTPLSVEICHCTANGVVPPVAATPKDAAAVWPTVAIPLCGCMVIEGAALMVKVAAVLVTATPLASVTTTSYSVPDAGRELLAMVRVAVAAPLIPESIVRGRKRGFSIPAAAWLRGELEPLARSLLAPERTLRQGYFKPEPVTRLLDEHVARSLAAVKLIYLTMNTEPDVAAEAFRRGASGYVVKSSAAEELVTAIRKALRSESYLSPMITKETVEFLLRSGQSYAEEKRITQRQSEVLQLLAEGMSMKGIASILNLKPGTVAFHKYRIMHNLGLKTNAELLQYAIKHHMIA